VRAVDLGIKGRKAIVCASSKGLGRACAVALAEAGCEVVVNGRNPDELQRTAKDISERTGATVLEVTGDLDDPATRAALIAACPEADILVNNNGGPPFKAFAAITREDILKGVESNMLTPIALAQAFLPGMAARKFGRIINITSGSVRAPIAGLDVSSGARAGLTAFLASAARTHVRDNVTINSIQPGTFETDRQRSALERAASQRGLPLETARAEAQARNPAHRFGDPSEFGALCAFLASAKAGFITGQNILIDGGAFPGAF
jgi:3-oxoacyl-[acyl-carrier protein] reductase